MVPSSRGHIFVRIVWAYKNICGLATDMVAALGGKRADEVGPTPIRTEFRRCISTMLRISGIWRLLFCWHNISHYLSHKTFRSAYYLAGTLLNLAVVFLTGLIKISRPSWNVRRRRKPGSSPLVSRSMLSMYTCPPSSCSLHAERNCFPCGPPPQLPANSLLGGLLMARLKRLLGSLRSAYQSRCVMK